MPPSVRPPRARLPAGVPPDGASRVAGISLLVVGVELHVEIPAARRRVDVGVFDAAVSDVGAG